MGEPDNSWRSSMPREDRVKVCQHIMGKLGSYYRTVPEASLKEKTSAFESQAYSGATSRRDYLEKIAEGLSKVEDQVLRNSQQANAMGVHGGGSAGVQAQAMLRQQIQLQQQAQQQARFPNRQIQQLHQQQQFQMRAQQMMMQQRQQAQQHAQQQHGGSVKQEGLRKATSHQKRGTGLPETKISAASGKNNSTLIAKAATSVRDKSQVLNLSASVDGEMLRRKTEIESKQAPFSTAQSTMSGGVPSNEYLLFAGQHALTNQSASEIPVQRHGQSTPSQVQQMSQGQQSLPQGQGQDSQSAALSHHSLRHPQGMPQQSSNMASVGNSSATVLESGNTGNDEGSNASAVMAALAARAAATGVEFTQEQIQNLTPDQIRQMLAVASQRNGGVPFAASTRNLAMGNASSQNMGSWMSQFPSTNAVRGTCSGQVQLGVGQNHAFTQAFAFEKQKHLQQLQVGAQVGAAGQQGKEGGPTTATSTALQAGVTVPQMNAIVAKEKGKVDRSGGPGEEKQGPFNDVAFQAGSRNRTVQPVQNNGQMQIRNGVQRGVANVAAAAAAAAAAVAQPGSKTSTHRGPIDNGGNNQCNVGSSRAVNEAEFWAKLEEMKAKYKQSLQGLSPLIRRLQERQPVHKQELFMKHLTDCFNILNLQRSRSIPPRLTIIVLERAERFIHEVVSVYSLYLKDFVKTTNPDPAKRPLQTSTSIDGARGSNAGSHSTLSTQNASGQDGSQAPARTGVMREKQEPDIAQRGQSHFDRQHQYSIQQQAQLQQQMQKQKMDILKRQVQQRQQQQQAQQGFQHSSPHPFQASHVSPQAGGQTPLTGMDSQSSQLQALRNDSHVPISPGNVGDNAKSGGKPTNLKISGGKSRGGGQKSRGMSSMPVPRPSLPGTSIQTPTQALARTQATVEAQVQAQVQSQAQSQAVAHARSQAQATASVHSQVTQTLVGQTHAVQAYARVPSHGEVPTRNQISHAQSNLQQIRLANNRGQPGLNQKNQMRALPDHHRLPPPNGVPSDVKQHVGNGMVSGWTGGRTAIPDFPMSNVMISSRERRQEMTLQQHAHVMEETVKDAVKHAQHVEQYLDSEMKRAKNERIQNTLAALRNNGSIKLATGKGSGTKRQVSLVDVDNFGQKAGVIQSKTVFECSSEDGLRLAKKPKNEEQDLKSLREAVEADCRAAQERNPLLFIDVFQEFGQPVVTCLLKIMEIRLPKLVLRVQRGYPRKGGATYGFERPPMGWVGVLDEIRTRFKRALATAPAASVGVAAFLDSWAGEADAVINGSHLSENR